MSNGKVCICVTSGNRWNKHAAVGLCLTPHLSMFCCHSLGRDVNANDAGFNNN